MLRLDHVANVALRVPSVLLLDLLYKCDVDGVTEHVRAKNDDMLFKYKYVIWNVYYLGGDYVQEEVRMGYGGGAVPVGLRRPFNRIRSPALTSLIILNTLCAFLMKTRKVWLFSAHLLPLLARLCAVPPDTLLLVSSSSVVLTGVGVASFLLSNLFVPYRLARAAYSQLLQMEVALAAITTVVPLQVVELYRLVAVGMSLWNQFAVPVLFSVFWMVLFVVQLGSDIMAAHAAPTHQGVLFILLSSVSECCATPYSLLGLTFVVSYLALGLLNLCKFYLGGGVTEGVTLFLLALQTGLLDMQALQRTFLLSIILFIVLTSTLQSMIEITDPVILALGASRNRCMWKHLRGLSMCLLLLVFPGFMAYKISQFFHMDFWLLILVSSCMLTSLQVTGTLLIYSLFMVELFYREPIESLDEVIYWVNAVSRVLEFVVALCVVAYGTWESLFGEWSWMGASVIIIHSYFNVWLRAQSGWRSFLLRQEAAKKINSLPRATAAQLQRNNDVCSICFQEMSSAVITLCGHFFHANCLRKWLYVQETCPMCHQSVRPDARPQNPSPQGGEDGEGQGQPDLDPDPDPDPDPPQGDTGPGLSPSGDEQSGNHGNGGSAAEEIYECPSEGEEEGFEEEEEEEEEEDGSDDDLNTEAIQGLCFSSSGDFVGFAAPGWSCPPVGRQSASAPWDGSLPGGVEEEEEEEEESRANRPSGAGDSGLADTEESLPPPPPPPSSSSSPFTAAVGRAGGVEGVPGGGEERGRPSADPRMNAPPCAAPGNRTVLSHGPAGDEHHGGESPSVTEPDSLCGEEPDLEEAQ
ncbi:hypothetical protein CRUP_031309 [Coryphaenoides rupestris]|nr:hypothetical protein CRUP_031309 [Coryphaenoides rupestris]